MAIRLEEMHPTLVHLPLGLVPLAVAADWIGTMRDDDALREAARVAIRVAAVGAVAAASTGLIAGEEVNEGAAHDMLTTHRNLNAAATVTTLAMASWRSRHDRPGPVYLTAGVAAVALLGYSAYLGGRMVYAHGVAVEPAGGVSRPGAPTMRVGRLRAFAAAALVDLFNGVRHMAQEVSSGRIAPHLTNRRRYYAEPRKRRFEREPRMHRFDAEARARRFGVESRARGFDVDLRSRGSDVDPGSRSSDIDSGSRGSES